MALYRLRDKGRKLRFFYFFIPNLSIHRPFMEFRRNIAITFSMEKLEWCIYQMAKGLRICLVVSMQYTLHERDRRTHRQMDGHRMTVGYK